MIFYYYFYYDTYYVCLQLSPSPIFEVLELISLHTHCLCYKATSSPFCHSDTPCLLLCTIARPQRAEEHLLWHQYLNSCRFGCLIFFLNFYKGLSLAKNINYAFGVLDTVP